MSSVIKYKRLSPDKALRYCMESSHLDGLKYLASLYSFDYVEYLYKYSYDGKFFDQLKAIEIAKQWNDLDGLKKFLALHDSEAVSLYSHYASIYAKLSTAKTLLDLDGLQSVFDLAKERCSLEENKYYSYAETFFYSLMGTFTMLSLNADARPWATHSIHQEHILKQKETEIIQYKYGEFDCKTYCNYTNDDTHIRWFYGVDYELSDIRLAASLKDVEAIDQMSIKHPPAFFKWAMKKDLSFLSTLYYEENFELCEKFIKIGALFFPGFLLRPNSISHTKQEYENHIYRLRKDRLIDKSTYQKSGDIIELIYSHPISKPSSSCSLLNIFTSHTYLQKSIAPKIIEAIFIEALELHYFASNDVLYYLALNNLYDTPTKLFITDFGSSIFIPSNIADPYKNSLLYIRHGANTGEEILHESTHFLLCDMFDNDGKPYTESDETHSMLRFTEYEKAVHETLSNILYLVDNNAPPKERLYSLVDQLLSYPHARVINWVFRNKHKSTTLTQNQIKERQDFYDKLDWQDDEKYIVYRISSIFSNKKDLEIEMLPRLPELILSAHNKTAAKHLLDPLAQYWKNYISPEVWNSVSTYESKYCTETSDKPCIGECLADGYNSY